MRVFLDCEEREEDFGSSNCNFSYSPIFLMYTRLMFCLFVLMVGYIDPSF